MDSVRPTKEFIVAEIQRLAALNGKAPSQVVFAAEAGIPVHAWKGVYWSRWNDAVREAGATPNEWPARQWTDAVLIRVLADFARNLGRFPTQPDIQLRSRNDPDFPGLSTYQERIGRRADILTALRTLAATDPAYADLGVLLADETDLGSKPKNRLSHTVADDPVVTGYVYLIRSGEFHKIGMTNHLGRRMFQIELQLPEKAELVHHIETDDPRGIEAYWHKRFAESRVNGEWFRLHAADIAAFKRRTHM